MGILLYKILLIIFAIDIFTLGVLILFLINARINLKREIQDQRFFFNAYSLALSEKTSADAASYLHVPVEEFLNFCKKHNIETPEQKNERIEKEIKQEESEKQRILEEEATWRAEQERIIEERRKSQEEEARKRKERLKKFGFR